MRAKAFAPAMVLSFALFAARVGGQTGEFSKVGTTAAQFLKVDVGARAIAMGGCFGALANDASALYWNPAGIANITGIEATFTHTNWIADITHDFVGVVFALPHQTAVGLSAVYQTMGEIEQTTIEQPKGTGLTFTSHDFAIGLTYARAMTDFINVGITGKVIYQKIWNESALGFGVDVGMLLDTGVRGFKVAMTMTNFGTDLKLDGRDLIRGYDQMPESVLNPHTEARLSTEPWPLPTCFRLSVTTDVLGGSNANFQSDTNRLTVIVDATHPNDNPEHYSIGFEYAFMERLFARVGYRGNTDEEGLTAGAGIYLPLVGGATLKLDYAYADFGIFNSVQHFTVGIAF